MDTKACNLTKEEVEELIMHHGCNLDDCTENRLERINYLHKRLKAFFSDKDETPASIGKDANSSTSQTNAVWPS